MCFEGRIYSFSFIPILGVVASTFTLFAEVAFGSAKSNCSIFCDRLSLDFYDIKTNVCMERLLVVSVTKP